MHKRIFLHFYGVGKSFDTVTGMLDVLHGGQQAKYTFSFTSSDGGVVSFYVLKGTEIFFEEKKSTLKKIKKKIEKCDQVKNNFLLGFITKIGDIFQSFIVGEKRKKVVSEVNEDYTPLEQLTEFCHTIDITSGDIDKILL